jgi:hypothetical protein
MRSAVLLSVLLVIACSGESRAPLTAPTPPAAAEPPVSPAEAPVAADVFPTPYSAEQIRDATRPGRAYTWRVEAGDAPAVERVVAFGQVDATGAELSSDGKSRRVSWEELRKHAEFPRAAVTTREETVTLPAGTFDCVVYIVAGSASGEVRTFYFAKSLPGAPVLFFAEKDGSRTMTSTLIRYAPGTGSSVDATPSRP